MGTWLLHHKWELMISLEILAWIFTFLMMISRYKWKSNNLFTCFTILAIIFGYVPHTTLAIIDFVQSRTASWFQLFILLLLVYAFTLGKKHLLILDEKIKAYFE